MCLEDPNRSVIRGAFTPFPCAGDVFKVPGIEETSHTVTGLTPGRPGMNFPPRYLSRLGSCRHEMKASNDMASEIC